MLLHIGALPQRYLANKVIKMYEENKSSLIQFDEPCLGDFTHEVVERLLECDTKCGSVMSCCCTYNLITTHDITSLCGWNLCDPTRISHNIMVKHQTASPHEEDKLKNSDDLHPRKSGGNARITGTSPRDSMSDKMYAFVYHDDIEQYIRDYRKHVQYPDHHPQVVYGYNRMNNGEDKIPMLRHISSLMAFSDWVKSVNRGLDISSERHKLNRQKRSKFEQNNTGVNGVPLITHTDSRATRILTPSRETCDYQQRSANRENSTLSSHQNRTAEIPQNPAKPDPRFQMESNTLLTNPIHDTRYNSVTTNTQLRNRVGGKSCDQPLHVISVRSNVRALTDTELLVSNPGDRGRVKQTSNVRSTRRSLARCQIGHGRSTWLMNKNLCHVSEGIPSLHYKVLTGVQSLLTSRYSSDKAGICSDQQSRTVCGEVKKTCDPRSIEIWDLSSAQVFNVSGKGS